mmetsp:Transcript_19406/g.28742  ORF Transcript_19406/g.28742 Transcript_19406/m.28742 type:complete len:266 (-) Transcript_19406:45-842(-)|eukprot:CAMPEP_0171480020 /NCGR_PEP_ID=MMETSP0946-20130122/5802_1 /TAXON_ID=109269 /ORGANISM="Vaucheria litorea, Strain CCMP2940" /LENGTH=265 /DNA_ID=CAMNT_0012011123 /DNA_START=17 /DNA_END=814 /DNA_ORIENTATION=-
MGDRGQTSVPLTDQTTEWDDILIKKGILTKDEVLRNKGIDPDEIKILEGLEKAKEIHFENLKNQTLEEKLASKTGEELEELEDEFDDDLEIEILEKIRHDRINEMKARASRARFGSVYEINKSDWIKEVNEDSEKCFVVVHLYQDSVTECRIMEEALRILAPKFKEVKFLKIRATQAIENWPEKNLPTLFIYSKGALSSQIIGLSEIGGIRMKPEYLEWHLSRLKVLETELETNPMKDVDANKIQLNRLNFNSKVGDAGDYDSDS